MEMIFMPTSILPVLSAALPSFNVSTLMPVVSSPRRPMPNGAVRETVTFAADVAGVVLVLPFFLAGEAAFFVDAFFLVAAFILTGAFLLAGGFH